MQSAYVLHARPYRETSLLLQLFTEQSGRIAAVARGARRPKNAWQSLLQPFSPLLIDYVGRTQLFTLTSVEAAGLPYRLQGHFLFSAFYVNELLARLLPEGVAMPTLIALYTQTLAGLAQQLPLEPWLRCFEKRLLSVLGYGLSLAVEISSGLPVEENAWYRFDPEQGPSWVAPSQLAYMVPDALFSGKSLLALHHENWSDKASLQDAKRLMRRALARQLGNQPLHTRQLFFVKMEDD